MAKELSQYRDHTGMLEDAIPYDEVNHLLGRA
jgi:hypothetical protein